MTQALPGVDATRSDLPGDKLVALLGRALRSFHDVPIAGCPFRFDLDHALSFVRQRVLAGLVDRGRHLHPEHQHLTPAGVLAELEARRPAAEDLVLCHGDYCLPNVLLSKGRVTGYLDLGEMGVADRWWDLAAGTWSVTWNLGQGREDEFLAAYGVARDELYDLAS